MVGNYGFLFGAGADAGYNLPFGPRFTTETLLRRRTKMYDALHNYYHTRLPAVCPSGEVYVKKYLKQFLFQKNSHTFREIIENTSSKIEINSLALSDDSRDIVIAYHTSQNTPKNDVAHKYALGRFENLVASSFDGFVTDLDEDLADTDRYKTIKDNLSYYGAVEKDFASIINPNDAGLTRFWRIINYFWSAFFSIVLPLLSNSTLYHNDIAKKSINGEQYSYVLNHLSEVLDYLWGDEYAQKITPPINYYQELKEHFSPSCVLTTNYTPFAENILEIKDIAYLAGKICSFELPHKYKIVEHRDLENDDFFFPYMLTQAYVKPIISPYQLEEYAKSLNYLKNMDTLIVLGYSLCANDSHILSMLREFIKQPEKHMIYCQREQSKDRKTKASIMNALRLPEEECMGTIRILEFDEHMPNTLVMGLKRTLRMNY